MKTPSILAILTILVCIATAGLGFVSGVKVKEVIQAKNDALDAQSRAEQSEQTAIENLNEARSELEDKERTLADLEIQLKTANTNFREQTRRANDLENKLSDVTRSRNDYERQLSLWEAVGLSIDDAKRLRDDLRSSQTKIDVLEAEGAELARRLTVLDNKLKLYELADYEVKLPSDISGTVTAVDPKYHFVVLNVGRNQELLEEGKVSISRDGKLVAKARITKVDNDSSIANPLSGWSIDNIQPGDKVFTAIESRKD